MKKINLKNILKKTFKKKKVTKSNKTKTVKKKVVKKVLKKKDRDKISTKSVKETRYNKVVPRVEIHYEPSLLFVSQPTIRKEGHPTFKR